jgi:hypothetical protein
MVLRFVPFVDSSLGKRYVEPKGRLRLPRVLDVRGEGFCHRLMTVIWDSGGKPRAESLLRRAGEGIRTLDIQLGKLALCQLSYARDPLILTSVRRNSKIAKSKAARRADHVP